MSKDAVDSLRQSLPKLKVIVESLAIDFENDLRFMELPNQPFQRAMLTRRIHSCNGSRVRIAGYILPSFKPFGIKRFVLVRYNIETSFGPGPPLYEAIVVEMKQGTSLTYTARPVVVKGKFSIQELRVPKNGKVRAVFRMSDASVGP